jgi:spore coat polysaccharide biosynthesis protein SpsF
MKIIAVTQARTGSTRLPGKILKTIQGETLLEIHVRRILRSKHISKLIIATTTNQQDDEVENLARTLGVEVSRGSESDVLDRFYQALKNERPDYVVRLTSDCPLIDANLIDEVIQYTINNALDYCTNTLVEHFPDGEDVEVFTFKALEEAWKKADKTYMKEHVTPYIRENGTYSGGSLYRSDNFPCEDNYGNVRLTVDEEKDLQVVTELVAELGTQGSWKDYANKYRNAASISNMNADIKRNEGFKKQ